MLAYWVLGLRNMRQFLTSKQDIQLTMQASIRQKKKKNN
jgi:hypothetical protein